jgi:hypothetical protein
MIHHHINEIHLNNSMHPVHIILMMKNYILINITIDEEMIGMIHGIGIFAIKIINSSVYNLLDQEIMVIVIVVHQVVVENHPIHLPQPHLPGKFLNNLIIFKTLFYQFISFTFSFYFIIKSIKVGFNAY